jgi:hypothetical protein
MPNIKFNYLYRDGANYKNHGFTIFENPQNIKLDDLLQLIQSKLIDKTWFYVDQWQLPDLHFGTWDNEIDHTWHEFENVEYTTEPANVSLELVDFITAIKKT